MHIPLPNGDVLIPDGEFAEKLGATRRTLGNLDRDGCPFVMVAGLKYRPLNEGTQFHRLAHQAHEPAPRPAQGCAHTNKIERPAPLRRDTDRTQTSWAWRPCLFSSFRCNRQGTGPRNREAKINLRP